MAKSPLILAALAKDAVPSLNFTQVKAIGSNDSGLFDTALLTEASGEHFTVKVPRGNAGGVALDTELNALRAFTPQIRSGLPFEINKPIGESNDGFGTRAVVFSFIYGHHIDMATLGADSPLCEAIGKSLASLHNLPTSLVENAGMPSYSPQETVRLRVTELDRAAQTGRVPSVLLNRWEQALEDVSLFKYQPTVVHGDLNGENMIELDGQVTGLLNWGSLRVSDPAEDFAWILGSQNLDANYSIQLAYSARRDSVDSNLKQRATLYSELEIARWLIHGYKTGDQEIIADAVDMLSVLAAEVEAGEAPSIGTTPIAAAVAAPVVSQELVSETPEEAELPVFAFPSLGDTGAMPIVETTSTASIEIIDTESEAEAEETESELTIEELFEETSVEVEVPDPTEAKSDGRAPKDNELF